VRRIFGGAVAVCAVMAAGVPAAQAGVLYTELPGASEVDPLLPLLALAYSADAGANNLTVTGGTGGVVFADSVVAAAGAPPPECPTAVPLTCSLERVQSLAVSLGDEDDAVSVGGTNLPADTKVDGNGGEDRADYSGRTEPTTIALDGSGAGGVTFSNVEDATGGSGADTIVGSNQATQTSSLVGAGGDDTITGRAEVDHISGGSGADTVDGGAGDDIVHGNDGDDVLLEGGAGNDVLIGDAGQDKMSGGAGDDRILAADNVPDVVDCGTGDADTVVADFGDAGDFIGFDCEYVTGFAAPDSGTDQPSPSGSQPQPVTTASSGTSIAAPVPVLADAVATPGDRRPPTARMRIPVRQLLTNVLKRGVYVPVSCSESCGISVAILLDRTTAKKLDLAGRAGPAVLATASAQQRKPGVRRLRVRLTQSARRALRASKTVTVTVQSLVSDASGNGNLLQRRVTLRR
jgi:hypothetical protein